MPWRAIQTSEALVMLSQVPCTQLKGVGVKIAEALERLNIHSVQDLLFHLPIRYQNRAARTQIQCLQPGDVSAVMGTLGQCHISQGRRRSLLCQLNDETGTLTLRFFNFSKYQFDFFTKRVDSLLSCFGEVRKGVNGLEMFHPEIEWLEAVPAQEAEEEVLTPIYPAGKGLNQMMLRKLSEQALDFLKTTQTIEDYLPEKIKTQYQLLDLVSAIQTVHRPLVNTSLKILESGQHPAQQRLAFEELMAHQMGLRKLRHKTTQYASWALKEKNKSQTYFLSQLPFDLTAAQERAYAEIAADLEKPFPMMRLLQGDVGSGKTVVAALALLRAVENGHQAALMAPTELLAEQHYQSLKAWFAPLGVMVGYLSGSIKAKEKKETLDAIANGALQVVVGTHALFQEAVTFKSLALSVIDEQHRFGVHQRLSLKEKGAQAEYLPHQLIMTATPIPRTLAMTAYADLDTSIIDELPKSRKPIATLVISNSRRDEVLERIRENCQLGKQAYWVCTLIEESEILQCQAAEKAYESLVHLLPTLNVGLVHGRIKPGEKEAIMHAFKQREIDLLIATTVIEVGIDVPNASLMVIENAERLGLAQLHQLRGRVGRGTEQSYCVLLYQSPLSNVSRKRLMTLRESNNGFFIAQKDLELRGPGEVLGARQAGFLRFRAADLVRDEPLLPQVREATDHLLQHFPERAEALIRRWLPDEDKVSGV